MTKVIGVRFRTAGKIYFFAPGKFDIKCGDNVIVETARGVEFGRVVSGPRDVKEKEVVQPLKPVLRIATEQDCRTVEKNHQKENQPGCGQQDHRREQSDAYKGQDMRCDAAALGGTVIVFPAHISSPSLE